MNRILTYPEDEAKLRRKAKRVKNPQSTEVILCIQAMMRLADQWEMDNAPYKCAGLAAPQIGVPLRIVIIRNTTETPSKKWLVMYNPVYVKSDGMYDSEEGCLSVPGVTGMVLRPERSWFHYYDECLRRCPADGEYEALGFASAEIVHEIDHLNGVLFIDSAYKVWRTGSKPEDVPDATCEGEYGQEIADVTAV